MDKTAPLPKSLSAISIINRFGTNHGPSGYWEFLVRLAGGLAMAINALPPEEQEAVRSGVRQRLAAGQAGAGYRLAGVALNAVTS